MKKFLILLTLLIGLLALTISSVSAQDCPTTGVQVTTTFTETQINSTFWVNNPVDPNLSKVYIDLQADNGGQVMLDGDYSYRSLGKAQSASVSMLVVPSIDNGRVDWSITSMTVNDQPASSDLIDQINTHIGASWHRWISENTPAGAVTAIAITDDDITFTYSPWEAGCATEEPSGTDEAPITLPITINGSAQTLTVTEADLNSAFHITNPANRNLSNLSIDLQAANGGQATISVDYSYRARGSTQTAHVAAVFVPNIHNGRVEWTTTSITLNGQPAPDALVGQINGYITTAWDRWLAAHAQGVVTSVTITDSDITFAYTTR